MLQFILMLEPAPNGWILLKTLNPKAQGNESKVIKTKLMITAFFLSIFNNSIVQAIIFSKTAITVESDAKDINKKNNAPQIWPPVIETKTLGNYNMDVIDAGIAVLNMHAPMEIVSKVDVYETYQAYKAFLKDA